MVILDTDHISLLERKDSIEAHRLRKRLGKLSANEITTTIITYEEQMRGWLAVLSKSNLIEKQVAAYQRLKKFLKNYCEIVVLEFDEDVVEEFLKLENLKIRIGTMDLRIAAIALANDAILLTRNLKDFEQVPDLKVEDWTK